MSVTVSHRMLASFVAGAAVALIAVFVFQAMAADAAPGDTDATFVATTPCRLIDTRPGGDHVGPFDTFGIDETETVQARGSNGECVIPSEAVGVSLNVTAVNATSVSFLTIWPDGTRPLASSLNPSPGQPPTPNAVTTNLSAAGSFKIYNLAGTVDVIVDVNGHYTNASLQDLDQRLLTLESAVASLRSKTSAMSVEDGGSTVRFSGVDVQIVDGSGTTRCGDAAGLKGCNGSGNLIVGYNENPDKELRGGSHNIVTGTGNDYRSHSGIVAGLKNTTSAEYATVTGGSRNQASGDSSSVSGGIDNTASGEFASVSGGSSNDVYGDSSSVSGGRSNNAFGVYSSVSGGRYNDAYGDQSSVSGGSHNTADGDSSSVSGGYSRSAAADSDWAAGSLYQND